MGTNKGASQSGMSYGKARGINDMRVSEGSTGTGSPVRSNRSSMSSQSLESPRADLSNEHDALYDEYVHYQPGNHSEMASPNDEY